VESNWRFGIWEWGFSHTNCVLIARLVVPNGVHTGVALFTNGAFRLVELALAPGQVPRVGTPAVKAPGTTRFPFGQVVFPD
jgi:hypothetical protein